MNIDMIRGVTAYVTAALAVLVGLASLIWLTANGTVEATVGVPAIVAIIAGASGFLFGAEVSKQASKQAERNIMQQPPGPPAPPPAA